MARTDRRVRRTRERLQTALIELMGERRYDTITVQEIVERAGVGRTTFYLHFGSKDDLFMGCHEAFAGRFRLGPRHPLSREELLSSAAPPGMTAAFRHLGDARTLLGPILEGKDGPLILRRIRDGSARAFEASLRTAFAEGDASVPVDVLANLLAGAQIGLVQWWLEERRPHAPETVAQTFQRLQRAAIRDAFGLRDGE